MKSFGVICSVSDKIICIQRQNSIACVDILMGNFKTWKSLRELAFNLTPDELYHLQTKKIEFLEVKFQARIPKRIKNAYPIISKVLNSINKMELYFQDTEILLPKGRPKKNETNLITAKREFFEETGCFINFLNPQKYYIEKYMGPENKIEYQNIYYTGKLKRFNPNYSCREVSKVYLLTKNEFYHKIDPRRIQLKNLFYFK